jgi:hypothetical protein
MRLVIPLSRVLVTLGLAWGITIIPAPAHALYQLLTTIPVPADAANPYPGGPFTTYDISFFMTVRSLTMSPIGQTLLSISFQRKPIASSVASPGLPAYNRRRPQ